MPANPKTISCKYNEIARKSAKGDLGAKIRQLQNQISSLQRQLALLVQQARQTRAVAPVSEPNRRARGKAALAGQQQKTKGAVKSGKQRPPKKEKQTKPKWSGGVASERTLPDAPSWPLSTNPWVKTPRVELKSAAGRCLAIGYLQNPQGFWVRTNKRTVLRVGQIRSLNAFGARLTSHKRMREFLSGALTIDKARVVAQRKVVGARRRERAKARRSEKGAKLANQAEVATGSPGEKPRTETPAGPSTWVASAKRGPTGDDAVQAFAKEVQALHDKGRSAAFIRDAAGKCRIPTVRTFLRAWRSACDAVLDYKAAEILEARGHPSQKKDLSVVMDELADAKDAYVVLLESSRAFRFLWSDPWDEEPTVPLSDGEP